MKLSFFIIVTNVSRLEEIPKIVEYRCKNVPFKIDLQVMNLQVRTNYTKCTYWNKAFEFFSGIYYEKSQPAVCIKYIYPINLSSQLQQLNGHKKFFPPTAKYRAELRDLVEKWRTELSEPEESTGIIRSPTESTSLSLGRLTKPELPTKEQTGSGCWPTTHCSRCAIWSSCEPPNNWSRGCLLLCCPSCNWAAWLDLSGRR